MFMSVFFFVYVCMTCMSAYFVRPSAFICLYDASACMAFIFVCCLFVYAFMFV